METVKSPAQLAECLTMLSNILCDAMDIITEAECYLRHSAPTTTDSYCILVRPDGPPERVPVSIIKAISKTREEANNDGVQGTDAPQ